MSHLRFQLIEAILVIAAFCRAGGGGRVVQSNVESLTRPSAEGCREGAKGMPEGCQKVPRVERINMQK